MRTPARRGSAAPRDIVAVISVGVCLAALAGLLAAGAASRQPRERNFAAPLPSLLPSVDVASRAATVWSCPGPLQVSGGDAASISIENPSEHTALASVLVAETEVHGAGPGGHHLATRVTQVRVGPRRTADVAVPADPVGAGKRGAAAAAVDASVAVTVTGAAVGVVETARSSGRASQAPCATGDSSVGYLTEGATAGSSDVHVAVFDPEATAAVVDVTVGTGAGAVGPEALQGLVVPPRSLEVFDLARFVPQRSHVGVEVTARVGRIAIGSTWSVHARYATTIRGLAHHYVETGSGIEVGAGTARDRLELPLGAVGASETEALRLFDPSARPARLELRTTAGDAKVATLSVTVPPGHVVTVAAPVAVSAPAPSHDRHHRRRNDRRPGATAESTLVVESTNGVGVVASRDSFLARGPSSVTVRSLEPIEPLASAYVLPAPASPAGRRLRHNPSEELVLSNLGSSSLSVALDELVSERAPSGSPSEPVATVTVPAHSSVTVSLGSVVGSSAKAGSGFELEAESSFAAALLEQSGELEAPIPLYPTG